MINSYAGFQDFMDTCCVKAQADPDASGHGRWWRSMSFEKFVTDGKVKNQRIVEVGDPEKSILIHALRGDTPDFENTPAARYGRMPLNAASFFDAADIDEIADWIKRGCPNEMQPVVSRDQLVAHPTYVEHVRLFFDPVDIDHMREMMKIDLGTYAGVKANASRIYFQTSAGRMPKELERRWPADRVQTFRNWMVDKFPMGVSRLETVMLEADVPGERGMRPDAGNLATAEVTRLANAFEALIARKPDDPTSYFAIAGLHWLPAPSYCVHHAPPYNSWHRVYTDRFESALRTVPGCEDISVPYWDILKPIPDWLMKPPFNGYVLPADADSSFTAGFVVPRFDKDQIEKSIQSAENGIAANIEAALNAPNFEGFALAIEQAHDSGHSVIGPYGGMGTPELAAFDPIFWFFHCNWERMWWSWQKRHRADTLASFRSTLSDQTWLDDALFNQLEPFGLTTLETIDAATYSYEQTATLFHEVAVVAAGSVNADTAFAIQAGGQVSLRVKGIERLRIRGTFVVHLIDQHQNTIARRAFFQSLDPQNCENCRKQEKVNIDFVLDRQAIEGKRLEVMIETIAPNAERWLPMSAAGAPTINVRELLNSQ